METESKMRTTGSKEQGVGGGAGSKEQGAGGKETKSKEQGGGGKGQETTLAGDRTFENLEVWQEAVDLAVWVYELFRECRDYEFRGQIQRAAVSVSNNIAEGYERDSNTEFIRFLFIAKASCGEVRSQTYIAQRVKLLNEQTSIELIERARGLSKRIQRLINVRREKFN